MLPNKTNTKGYTYYSNLGTFLQSNIKTKDSIDKNKDWGVNEIFSDETLAEIEQEAVERFLRNINSVISKDYCDSISFNKALHEHWDACVAIKLDSYLLATETNLKPAHSDLFKKIKVKRLKAWLFFGLFVCMSSAGVWLNHKFLGAYTVTHTEEGFRISSILITLPTLLILSLLLISDEIHSISRRTKAVLTLLSFPVSFYPCIYLESLIYNSSPTLGDSWIIALLVLFGWWPLACFSILFSYAWLGVLMYYILDEYTKDDLRRRFGHFS